MAPSRAAARRKSRSEAGPDQGDIRVRQTVVGPIQAVQVGPTQAVIASTGPRRRPHRAVRLVTRCPAAAPTVVPGAVTPGRADCSIFRRPAARGWRARSGPEMSYTTLTVPGMNEPPSSTTSPSGSPRMTAVSPTRQRSRSQPARQHRAGTRASSARTRPRRSSA